MKAIRSCLFHLAWSLCWIMAPILILLQPLAINSIQNKTASNHTSDPARSNNTRLILLSIQPWSVDQTDSLHNFLTPREIAHLSDVQQLLKLSVVASILSFGFISFRISQLSRSQLCSQLKSAATINTIIVIVIFALSLWQWDQAFILFHEILFPAGNWSFPIETVLIQLFPDRFWQAIAIVTLVIWLASQWVSYLIIRAVDQQKIMVKKFYLRKKCKSHQNDCSGRY